MAAGLLYIPTGEVPTLPLLQLPGTLGGVPIENFTERKKYDEIKGNKFIGYHLQILALYMNTYYARGEHNFM